MNKVICKGLTKLLIKESKDKELQFDKGQLERIKNSAEVSMYKNDKGWDLYASSNYGESGFRDYIWRGSFKWDREKKEGVMEVMAGLPDGCCFVKRCYTCTRPNGTDYKKEFQTILEYMKKARFGNLGSMNCYKEYVAATGDIS